MNVRIYSGTQPLASIAPDNRGLAYGDGLFETMRAHRGDVPWWDAHWARLARGAHQLHLTVPEPAFVREQARAVLEGRDGVLKLQVTRGGGTRGYAPGSPSSPTWLLSVHDLPPPLPAGGVSLRWCTTRLALQPLLAGLKHCNRLEQVLARAEWNGLPPHAAPAEGLMRSMEGDVVCATAANVFVLRDDRWWTPAVDRCGVAGVCREWALAAGQAREARLSVTDVETADAVFLCNAVRGILPVARLGETRAWDPHPRVAALQERLAGAHPAFARP